MALSADAIEFRDVVDRLYREDRYFAPFLATEFRQLDDPHFRFGSLYRCIRSFCANDSGPHDWGSGHAQAGETMWFIGADYFAYDGIQALFFHDGHGLREFVFTDVRPETDGCINTAFKKDPHAYFRQIGDDSEIGAALADLRETLLQRKLEKWPRSGLVD